MSGVWFAVGAATIPATVAAVWLAWRIVLAAAGWWGRHGPQHWWLSGPARRATDAARLLRVRDARGGHVATIRRLLRVGPWGVYVWRYAPGHVDPSPEETR